jgi:cytochrome b561
VCFALLVLAALDVQRESSFLIARFVGFIVLLEAVRLTWRPRQPLPADATPLVRWTPLRVAVAGLALLLVAFLVLTALGLLVE